MGHSQYLNPDCRSREVASLFDRRRVDIACLQETRWKGQKSHKIGNGYKLIYNGTSIEQNGIAIAMNRDMRKTLLKCNDSQTDSWPFALNLIIKQLSMFSPHMFFSRAALTLKKTSGKNSTITWQHAQRKTCFFCAGTSIVM